MNLKSKEIDFSSIVKKLKNQGSSVGFRALRDFLLSNFNALKNDFTPAGLMGLVIAADKHAIFCDISSEKSKEHDLLKWKLWQEYISGKVDTFALPEDTPEVEDDELPVQEGEQGSEDGSLSESS